LRDALRSRRIPADFLHHLGQVAGGLDDLLDIKVLRRAALQPRYNFDSLGWFDLPDRDRRFPALDVHQMCEQSAHPDNRITLGDPLDATGMPVARVAFRWNELDIDSIARTQCILKEALESAGLGELVLARRDGYPVLAQMSAHHPSGTTRMSDDPRAGVVDGQCRVHGVENLFVASSSVFPSSGSAPPTLTILALAIRVADRVKSEMDRPLVATTG
jgi:choline dehydrogenase-like flavoprotein